jgi:aminopeptidase N
MFAKIARFEFRYQLRQPIFWVALLLFALLAFGSVASSEIRLGSTDNIHKNAPYVIAQSCLIFAVMYMFVVAAFAANVITRDDDTGFAAILRTTPIRKFDYLYGRFAGAFAALAVAFLAVPLGLWLGSLAPWIDRETLGPVVLHDYVYAYVVLALPVLFVSSALFFTLTTITRSMMWTYIGLIALLVLRSIFTVVLNKPGHEHVAALYEPFGTSAFGAATRYWTASERNTQLPAIAGDLLWNKVLWLALACGALALAYRLFSFASAERSGRRGVSAPVVAAIAGGGPVGARGELAKPSFGGRATRAQLWVRTRFEARQVFLSPAYFVLVGLAVMLGSLSMWLSTAVAEYGGRVFPVTRVMIQALGVFDVFALIIAIYYAGELVWRPRELRTQEIIDATPVGDWMFVGPKTLAISLVLISTLLVGVVVAMVMQLVRGYYDFELAKYFLWWVLPHGIGFVLLAVLAIFVQTLSSNKYIGWAVMAVYLIATLVLGNLGFEHHLYLYGDEPGVPLSDMDGQGRYWIGAYWFRLYWSACALILLVLACGLWRRGSATPLAPRLLALPRRLRGTLGVILAIAAAIFAGSGAFIFYNTNVLNPYRTHLDDERWAANYEKKFLRYETLPEPKVASVKLDVGIYPDEPRVETRGSFVLQNRTGTALSAIHVHFPRDLIVDNLTIDGAHLQKEFPGYNYRIYAFERPMQPGETRTLSFATTVVQHGFRNSGDIGWVVDNGTFINDQRLVPRIGVDRRLLLRDRTVRRKYGLPAELPMPKLGTPGADQVNYVRHEADWVTADITVTTDADQIAIAPGQAVSQATRDGRRTVRFVTDSPIMDFFSVQSARYEVATQAYKGVQISVYYDPHHPWNVTRIENAMRAGLDYYQAHFGPYQFHQVRVLEFPAPQGSFAQSYANTIAWSEGIFFIADNSDATRIDMVTYVGAHELAHQWWAHQIVGADEQGSTALSETLAQYSAAMVMKHMYGAYMMRKFLKFELDQYLRSRAGDVLEEEPLERVENQPYIHYRKGSLVMYRLQDELGEEAVNRALRQLLHDFAFKGPPYPTSLDLVRDLRAQAPADEQQLITDLFEKITLYDVKASHAVAKRRSDGRYDLTFTVDAKKVYADGRGHETPAPMDEILEVGAFDVSPDHAGYDARNVVALQKERIHSGIQTISLTVNRLPKFAGVDPFSELIDRDSAATIAPVELR